MARTSEKIYLGGIIGGTPIGYAIFEDDLLLGLVSDFDYRDGNLNGEVGLGEKLFGKIGNYIGPKQLLAGAYNTALNSPTGSLLETHAVELRELYVGDLINLLDDVSYTLQVEAIQAIVGTFTNLLPLVDTFVAVLDGGGIPMILATASGVGPLKTLAATADFSPEEGHPYLNIRDLSAETAFTTGDFETAPENSVFVTYGPSGTDESLSWAFSPNTQNDVFSDATGISNALLAVTPQSKTLIAGQSIAVSSLFPSLLWTDADGSYDITAFAIQDRTVGGGYLEVAGVRVPEATVYEFLISDLSNWRFVAASGAAVDEIGFNIIQADGDFSPKLTPGAIVTTKLPDVIAPPDNEEIVVEGTDITRLDLDLREGSSAEEGSSAKFTIQRRGNQDGDIIVQWTITGIGNNPADRRDFPAMSGTVTLRDGRGDKNFNIFNNDDQIDEFDEDFRVDLRVISGNAVFDDDDASFTIIDNDEPLGIDPNVDDHGNSFATATVVADDTWARGFIETAGDRDYFKIDLLGGVGYEFILVKDDDLSLIGGDPDADYLELPNPVVDLFNASGQYIATLAKDGGLQRWEYAMETPADGTYYMSVRQDGDNDVGQYFIKADVRIKADDFSADTSTIGELVVGGAIIGHHERNTDIDWMSVDLVEGVSYRFVLFSDNRLQVDNVDGGNGWYYFGWDRAGFAIHDSTGTVVQTRTDGYPTSSNLIEFTATQTGQFFVSVDGTSDQMYDYVVSVDEIKEQPTSPALVIQPDTDAITDIRFAGIRSSSQAAIDDDKLTVNGQNSSVIRFDLDDDAAPATYAAIELFLFDAGGTTPGDIIVDIPGALLDNDSTFGQIESIQYLTAVANPVVGQWVTIDITSLYNLWVSGEQSNYGIVLSTSETSSKIMSFYSSNYTGDLTLRPKLILDGPGIVPQVFGTTTGRMTEDENSVFGVIGLTGDDDFSGAAATGKWGSISFDATGSIWTYTLDARADILKQGEIVRDWLTLTSELGFSQTIRVKVTGIDDESVVVGAGRNVMNETSGKQMGSSVLFDVDADSQPSFIESSIVGTYGRFGIGTDGSWTYSLHALGKLALGSGESEVDNFKVFATDGTSIRYSFYVKGTDDDFINRAGAQADLVYNGGIGDDTIITGSGNDFLKGGSGKDTVSGGSGDDILRGGTGNDKIFGGTDYDTLYGGDGNDRVWGGNGRDKAYLGKGDDVFFDNAQNGKNGRDTVYGGAGKDTINGGGGNDKFYGGAGNDLIRGGIGNDTLNGGFGRDTFVFATGDGRDVIEDFNRGNDTIQLAGFGINRAQALNAAAQGGADVVIDLGGGDIITLLNTDLGSLTRSDFDIV